MKLKKVVNSLIMLGAIFLIAFLFRQMILDTYKVPTTSMVPQMKIGDVLLVEKISFGLKIPFFNKRLFFNPKIKRGDQVVFMDPKDSHVKFVKRVIALPNDRIRFEKHRIWVNGEEVTREYLHDFEYLHENGFSMDAQIYHETLPDGKTYKICFDKKQTARYVVKALYLNQEITIDSHHFFALGDNRDGSTDSRHFGPVPLKNLIGRPVKVFS